MSLALAQLMRVALLVAALAEQEPLLPEAAFACAAGARCELTGEAWSDWCPRLLRTLSTSLGNGSG